MVIVGVLAVQGDFAAHHRLLARCGVTPEAVRTPADLAGVDALVIPGGESTAMLHGIARDGLEEPLRAFIRNGRPVLGTCAGAILLARRVTNPAQRSLDALDIDVERNAYGTQADSFATILDDTGPMAGMHAIFIRAPRICRVGAGVEVLAQRAGDPVLVASGPVWAATFHPELSDGGERAVGLWLDDRAAPIARASHRP